MTEPSKSFQDLIVWQKTHQFVLDAYRFTSTFPKSETFALSIQFRRAAVSIAANIAEGYKKRTKAEKVRFMNIAQGSLEECRYYLILSKDLNYGDSSNLLNNIDEVGRLLDSYSNAIISKKEQFN